MLKHFAESELLYTNTANTKTIVIIRNLDSEATGLAGVGLAQNMN